MSEKMNHCEFDDKPLAHITENVTLARGWTAAATLAISLLLFIFALCNLARKYYRFHREPICCFRFIIDYVTSPFLLFAFLSLLPVTTYWLVLLHYKHLDKHPDFCQHAGYLLVWFESSETLALAVFSLYFLFYYIPFHSKKNAMLIPREYEEMEKKKTRVRYGATGRVNETVMVTEFKARVPTATKKYWYHSLMCVLASVAIIVSCGLYTCPYFVEKSGGNYTVEGPWCWIQPKSAQKYFWFFEEWVYMGVSTVTLSIALFILLCVTRPPTARFRICPGTHWDKTVLVPFGIFLFYFVLQFALMVIEILVRFCNNSNKALWYTYAIGKPLSKIFLVIAALQLMSTSQRMGKKEGGLLAPETT